MATTEQVDSESAMLWMPVLQLTRASIEDHDAAESEALRVLAEHIGASRLGLWRMDLDTVMFEEFYLADGPLEPGTDWASRVTASNEIIDAISQGGGYADFDLEAVTEPLPTDQPGGAMAVATVEAEDLLGIVAISTTGKWSRRPEAPLRGMASLFRHSRRRIAAELELTDRRRVDDLFLEVADVCLAATHVNAGDATTEICRLLGEFLEAEGVVIRRFAAGQAVVDTKWISSASSAVGPPIGHSVPGQLISTAPSSDHFIISAEDSPNPIFRAEMDKTWGGAVDAYVQLIHVLGRGVDTLNVSYRKPLPNFAPEAISGVASQLGLLRGRTEAEQYAEAAFTDAPVGIVLRGREGEILRANPVFADLFGVLNSESLENARLSELLEGSDSDHDFDSLIDGEFEARIHNSPGHPKWGVFETVEVELRSPDSAWLTYVTDITGQRRAEEMLRYDASHDELTGIPNRRALMRVLADSTDLCLLLIDLDRFKLVNDSLGHDRGDELLRIVADRLRLAIRPGDQVFRQGGDEFAIVVSAPATLADAKSVASRLCDLLKQPALLGPHTVYPGGSVGIAASSEDIDSSELLRRADIALYRAKSLGGSAAVTFDEALSEEFLHRAGTEAELRGALAENRIIAHFQPEISLVDGSLLGAEALARWNHPTEGVLATELFFQVAEKYGVIREIGERVMRDACAEAAGWPDDSLIVRVNLSAEEIVSEHTVDVVRTSLLASGLAPHRLCLEVTEWAATDDIDRSEIVMRGLKELGVELTLEDFGTGGSSLAGLRRLPIDSLKIDPSLVGDLGGDDDDESVGFVRLITSLADALGLAVVGQGVQTEAQADVLRLLGCASAQGDLFGRTAPPADLLAMMT